VKLENRSKGFMIGPQDELEMFAVIDEVPFRDIESFQLTLSQLLCRSRAHHLAFPELFDEFWQELFVSFNAKIKRSKNKSPENAAKPAASLTALKNWLYNHQGSQTEDTAFLGRGVNSTNQDLSYYHAEQIHDLARIVNQMARTWATKRGRRKIPSKSRGQIDLRKVLRKNLSTGELIDISFRENKIQKPRLVLVCDVSKSMELFSNFTVQLLYAFQNNYHSIETFVFGTELYHVSRMLKQKSFENVLNLLSDQVPDWSGGTRIGHCLDQLIQGYGSRLLHGKVIFIMISDGWDTGDIELLEQSMKYIKRRVKKLIWLNPQAGKPDFQPQVRGMVAALPYIDIFHGVHDVESFKGLRDLRS